MRSARNVGKFVSVLHISVRTVVLHRFIVLHSHCRIFCISRLGVESGMIGIPKEITKSERFGKPRDYLCLTDVLSSRSNCAVSVTADSGRN